MALRLRRRRDGSINLEPGTTLPKRHHFATRFVQRAAMDGTLTLGKGQIILHLADDDVTYDIVRTPGAYCVHCGERVADGPARSPEEVERRRHYVETCQKSPDEVEAAEAYEVIDYFDGHLATGKGKS